MDINLGCSTTSICRHNLGAALLRDVSATIEMVRQIRQAIRCPLTVKFRTGWTDDPQVPVNLARRLEDAGVDALTFHPRVAPDRRNRPPRWEYIGLVKAAVSIPVFGNGDVFDGPDCMRMLTATGCDGVALGRIAIARPWLFSSFTCGREASEDLFRQVALRLSALLQEHFEPRGALRRYKRYGAYLAANFAFGNSLFNGLRNAPDFQTIHRVLEQFFEKRPGVLNRPNMNFFPIDARQPATFSWESGLRCN